MSSSVVISNGNGAFVLLGEGFFLFPENYLWVTNRKGLNNGSQA